MKKKDELDFLYIKPMKKQIPEPTKKSPTKKKKKKKKKNSKKAKIIGFIFLALIFIGGIIAFLLSPLFNIKEIVVEKNISIASEKIIALSQIELEENTFKINKKDVIANIKKNPYVNSVKVKRKLPNTVILQIEERQTSFQIEFGTGYVYINNQGYILEISETKLNVPTIKGITGNLEEGNRLNEQDLKKLEDVLKIMKELNATEIGSIVTSIDITKENDYTLILEDEDKIVRLGDTSLLDLKISYTVLFLEREKGVKGEIIVNVDYNKNKPPYFRENVD